MQTLGPLLLLLLLLLLNFVALAGAATTPSQQVMYYAEWAHHHLVWKSNGHNQTVVTDMLNTYAALNISVGAVNVDSGWSTGFNNFVFDTSLFPDPKALIDQVHNNSQHIVLWVTSMIDTDSSNYAEAVANNYVFNKTLGWWHGQGRLLDFGNPAAVAWFEQQIDQNLFSVYGCTDGWKCDGTDPYILELGDPNWTWKRYADAYYGFFLNYTRQRCGSQALIMSRPDDCIPPGGIDHTGYCPLRLPYAPRNAVFMGWVGDQDSTFLGLNVAYGNMMASGEAGYISFGSDTGGYRGNGPDGIAKDLFLRWASLNAMMPVFENGGDNRHCPWQFDDDTVVRYRGLVDFHHALVPYLYSNGMLLAQQVTGSLVTPVATGGHWLGPSCFAYPILIENATSVLIQLPNTTNSTNGWYLHGSSPSSFYNSGELITFNATALDALPFFVEESTVMIEYDTRGVDTAAATSSSHRPKFPSDDVPIVVVVYAAKRRRGDVYSTTQGAYLGMELIEVHVPHHDIEEGSGTVAVPSIFVRWASSATEVQRRRRVKVCVVSVNSHHPHCISAV